MEIILHAICKCASKSIQTKSKTKNHATIAFGANLMIEHANHREQVLNQRSLASNPIPEPESEEKFEGTVKIEGEMAEKICKIVGNDCPPYYIGNPQSNGSLMVGITISDTVTEKQFVFLIKNGTLSYDVRE